MESRLTYFQSKYKMQWDENAIFAQIGSPYNISVANGQWDGNGALTRHAVDEGRLQARLRRRHRTSLRNSTTRDVGWNFTWRPDAQWTLKSDLQFITAKTNSFDSTVATGAQMAKETLDLRGSIPSLVFDDADRAAPRQPGQLLLGLHHGTHGPGQGHGKAWKGDAKYNFTDSDFSTTCALAFDRGARRRDHQQHRQLPLAAITQPWQVGWNISGLARLNDLRFSGDTYTHEFKNFFNGKASVPR